MPKPLRVAICEDTKTEEEKLLALLKSRPIETISTVFISGEALLLDFEPDRFDLLLMDIYMGGITGVEAVKKIREIDEKLPVAFITTSQDHTLESYRLSALKYIEKPFSQKDIDEILKLAQLQKEDVPSLILQKNGKHEKIPFSQIIFIEQQLHHCFICQKNKEDFFIYDKLSALLPQLPPELFFVPHKSFAVNLSSVKYIDADIKCFAMENGKNIPIRRESMGKAKSAFEQYLFNRTRGNRR